MNRLRRALLHAAPVAVTALFGAWWIAFHAEGGRGSAHTLWQSLALQPPLASYGYWAVFALATVASPGIPSRETRGHR